MDVECSSSSTFLSRQHCPHQRAISKNYKIHRENDNPVLIREQLRLRRDPFLLTDNNLVFAHSLFSKQFLSSRFLGWDKDYSSSNASVSIWSSS